MRPTILFETKNENIFYRCTSSKTSTSTADEIKLQCRRVAKMVASVGAGRDRKVLQRLWMHLSWQIVLVWKVRKSNADGSIAADGLGRSRARRANEDSVSASPRGEEGSGTLTSLKDLRSRREELSARHDTVEIENLLFAKRLPI